MPTATSEATIPISGDVIPIEPIVKAASPNDCAAIMLKVGYRSNALTKHHNGISSNVPVLAHSRKAEITDVMPERLRERPDRSVTARPVARRFIVQADRILTIHELEYAFSRAIIETGFADFSEEELPFTPEIVPPACIRRSRENAEYHDVIVVVERWNGACVKVAMLNHVGDIDARTRAQAALLASLFVGRKEQLGC